MRAPIVHDDREALESLQSLVDTKAGASTGVTIIKDVELGLVETYASAIRQALYD